MPEIGPLSLDGRGYGNIAPIHINKLIEPPTCFLKVSRIRCRNELGGMLNYYYRKAA